jgi:RNA polymerase sigma factor (TIGR02999 family)
MGGQSPRQVTQLLADARAGGRAAVSELMELVYEELRGLAHHQMANVPASDTLQPTALVHEAYLRLVGRDGPGWEDRAHFFNAAARAMRDIIVEQARKHARLKRGGGRKRITLDEAVLATADQSEDLLALDEALVRLERSDAASAEVVMLRFFAGLTPPDTARALGVSPATADRQWRYARAWLRGQFRGDGASDEHGAG